MQKLSKKTQLMLKEFDFSEWKTFDQAIEMLRNVSTKRKFIQSVEVEFMLKVKKKSNIPSRFVFDVVNGLPQNIKILAVVNSTMEKALKAENKFNTLTIGGEECVQQIIADGKSSFDMIVCTKDMFPKFTKHASILGPMKMMPSAKNGTVLDNVMDGVRDLLMGTKLKAKKVRDFVSLKIATMNFTNDQIIANYNCVYNGLIDEIKSKDIIKRIRVKLSMSPAINIILK